MANFTISAGSNDCPVLLHVPHASREIPAEVAADFIATDEQIAEELDRVTDDYTDALAAAAAEKSGCAPWMIVNNLSRLVADPGRFSNERDSMDSTGRGAIFTKLADGNPLRPSDMNLTDLKGEYYFPYADAVSQLVGERIRDCGAAVIVDLHSYNNQPDQYQIHPGKLLPDVCIGTHSVHTPALLADTTDRIFTAAGLNTERNTPFAGAYVPVDYDKNTKVLAIMLEVRKDLLENDGTRTRIVDAVAELIANAVEISRSEMGRPL